MHALLNVAAQVENWKQNLEVVQRIRVQALKTSAVVPGSNWGQIGFRLGSTCNRLPAAAPRRASWWPARTASLGRAPPKCTVSQIFPATFPPTPRHAIDAQLKPLFLEFDGSL